jgi:AcrR family transcriptional regulator
MSKPRRDAEANRSEILAAADVIFASHGVTAPLDLVCKEAGVGRATLYRHFPDRVELITALLERSIDAMDARAKELSSDPEAFFHLLRYQAERISRQSALVDYWRVLDPEAALVERIRARFKAVFREPLERAIAAGVCRADFEVSEVGLLVNAIGAALRGRTADEQARLGLRMLDLLTEGMRPRRPSDAEAPRP